METQYISLNMTPTGVNPCFHISQYDVGRMLGFIVHSGGATVDLDTYTCTIEATRSDGTAITSAVATTDNIGTFEVTPTMSNKADKYRCQLVIVDANSKRIASLPFDMEVTKAAMDENSEAIEEDKTLYQQYTETVQSTFAEIRSDLKDEVTARENAEVFVTPEMFGAVGDGITNDHDALASAFATGKHVRGKDNHTYYCASNIDNNICKHVSDLKIQMPPMTILAFHADGFLMEDCTFDHTDDFLNITGRGQFLIGCYGDNVEIVNCHFYNTVSAIFFGFEQTNVTVRNCMFNNIKQSPTAMTTGVNGYGIVTDSVKNLFVSNNKFIDVARHAVYISHSDDEYQITQKAIISNNYFELTDRESDKYITNYETQIMCRECVLAKVTDNTFINIYGGCFTYGGDDDFAHSNLIFSGNTVKNFWVISNYNYYGVVNINTTTDVERDLSINNNTIINCEGTILNANHKFNLCDIRNNNISTSNFLVVFSRSVPGTETYSKFTLTDNNVKTSAAILQLNNNLTDVLIKGNRLDCSSDNTFLVANSGNAYTCNKYILDSNVITRLDLTFKNCTDVLLINNVNTNSTIVDGSTNSAFAMYGNINIKRYGANDTQPLNFFFDVAGNTINEVLQAVFLSMSSHVKDYNKTIDICINAHSLGTFNGRVHLVTADRIIFNVSSVTRGYYGEYVVSNNGLSLFQVVTTANYANDVALIKQFPTHENQNVTVEFPDTDTNILLFCESTDTITYIYFYGTGVFANAILGSAHTVTVVDNKHINITCKKNSRAMIICGKHLVVT